MIDRRQLARQQNDDMEERRLHKEVRRTTRLDRTSWIKQMLSEGSWEQFRLLQKLMKRKQGRLLDNAGQQVDTDLWAETMADRLEKPP